ncbi:hypothetical protein J2W42_004338 [Rhizobium tibeticum]|uniref:hypothetical protein n=1 Tax=Rhizobium tibeticum TaxID=501024 RepID=UPI0027827DA7|nr:hypothetical protein [Rhizobium tibeticum]MDP9811474.1 hypothetical protein [Rhizobium tibeticum]
MKQYRLKAPTGMFVFRHELVEIGVRRVTAKRPFDDVEGSTDVVDECLAGVNGLVLRSI